jgi:hypothetical protein
MTQQVSPEVLAVAQALTTAFKAGDAGTPNTTFAHGPGGVLSSPMNQRIINAMVLPKLGLQSRIPVRGTVDLNPLKGVFTGVTEGTGSNPEAVCDTWPRGGNLKMAQFTYPFARRGFSTDTINLTDPRIGGIVNRGEFRDFQLVGNPLSAEAEGKVAPTVPGTATVAAAMRSELAKQMLTYKIGYLRKYGRMLYNGNPANNTTSGGALVYGEEIGLNILVNKGYQDAITGALVPAADSVVINVNLNVAGNGDAMVHTFTYAYRRQQKIAEDTGLAPARLAFVMPRMLFTELADVWPCAYNTNRCVVNANGGTVNLDAQTMRRLTDEMRNGEYLLIDGQQVEVIIDDAITETEGDGGEFSATVFLLPLSVIGSEPTLYIEHYDFNNPYSAEMRQAFSAGDEFMVTDNGRFFWTKRKNGPCVSMEAVEMPRLILDASFLAVRFANVKYTPLMVNRSGWPTDTNRFYNGGNTGLTAPSFYRPNIYA